VPVRSGKLVKVKPGGYGGNVAQRSDEHRAAVPELGSRPRKIARAVVVTVEHGKRSGVLIGEHSVEGGHNFEAVRGSLGVLPKQIQKDLPEFSGDVGIVGAKSHGGLQQSSLSEIPNSVDPRDDRGVPFQQTAMVSQQFSHAGIVGIVSGSVSPAGSEVASFDKLIGCLLFSASTVSTRRHYFLARRGEKNSEASAQ